MRAKRSKQYKKLIQQFNLHHGFREPYQVLVDADLVRDANRFTMDLQAGLERTLHGKVKIMITQCSIRHLYTQAREDRSINKAIDLAKTFERRRCGHKPEDYEEPLSTLECLSHVVDEKGRGENKHRYVVASQDQEVRRHMRGIAGVPLIYISRSVMIMEPMSASTAKVGAQAERAKFRSELRKMTGEKRKREDNEDEDEDGNNGGDNGGDNGDGESGDGSGDDDDSDDGNEDGNEAGAEKKKGKSSGQGGAEEDEKKKKKKKQYGLKAPNPLSVKKKKKKETQPSGGPPPVNAGDDAAPKKRRKRKHRRSAKSADEGGADAAAEAAPAVAVPEE